MNKFSTIFVILLLIGGTGFSYVLYTYSQNHVENLEIPEISEDISEKDTTEKEKENTKEEKKEKNYHIGDEEFWDKALEASCINTYDNALKRLCKHDREKIEVIAHWVEVGSETKYNIVYKAPDSNGERFYHSSMDKNLKEKGSSSGGESISQKAVAIKDCGEDKIYTYVNNKSERYDDTSTSIVTLKYELDDKIYEEKYVFDLRRNEILEKYTSTFIDEELAIKIISKDSGISKKIIEKSEDDDWLFEVQNGLNSEDQLYNYQFTDNGYTYNYVLDATNGKIKSKDIQKDIGEKGALDIVMNDLGITEDSFLRHHGEYMISFAFPDIKKEKTDKSILYKISLSENDDISHYYEINGHNGEILKHSFTTLYIINKKNGGNYDIYAESDKSIKYTINLKKIGMDDIYKFKDYIYLNIQYEGDNLIDWTIIDKDSNSDLGQLTNNELDELYNFESKHKIVYAGSFTGGEILLSSLKENIIYKYTIPKGSYCDPKIINDLGTDCIVYKKEEGTSNAIQYKSIPAPVLNYPWASPLHGYCTMGGDDGGFYITYKKATIDDLLNISKGKVLNLSSFNRGEKIDREHGRTSDIDYLYNDTNDDITLFISNGHSDSEGHEDMTVTIPPKQLIFCSYSVSDITLIKKGSGPHANIKMTKKEALDFALSDRGIRSDSINFTTSIQSFKDSENGKEIYQVIIKLMDKNNKEQLYITYIDIETRSVIITEKKLFEIISKEPGLSLKKINDGIKEYGLSNNNLFICSILSDGLTYDFTIDINEERIISRNIKNSKGENVGYGPDNQLYPIEKIDVHGNLYLNKFKENIIYKFNVDSEYDGRLYNQFGNPVITSIKSIQDNENDGKYETHIHNNNSGLGLGGSAEHDEEIYFTYRIPSTEELIKTIGEKNIMYISKYEKGEKIDLKDFKYLYNDTDTTQKLTLADTVYYFSENKEKYEEYTEYLLPGKFHDVSFMDSVIINPDFSQDNLIYLSKYKKGEEYEVDPKSDIIYNDKDESLGVIIYHEKKYPEELNGELKFIKVGNELEVEDLVGFLIVNF